MSAQVARIVYFINSLEQGGAERQFTELIARLDRTRFDPLLVTCTRRPGIALPLPPEKIFSLDSPMFPSPAGVWRLGRILAEAAPDIVHTSKGWENVIGRVIARLRRVPHVVATVCTLAAGIPLSQRLSERLTATMADVHIVNSRGIKEMLVGDLSFDAQTVVVIENGVALGRFRPFEEASRRAERQRRGLDGAPLLVMSGRISPEKNQLSLVRALRRMKADGVLPSDLRIALAGRDSLLFYGRRVRAEARLARVGDHLVPLGAIGDIESLVAAADGVILPSVFEGLPNAVIEAMACGIPAIVSQAANADRMITDGVEGLVTATHDPEGIDGVLRRFVALDDSARKAMGARGRAHAERRFTMARMVSETEEVYEGLLRRGPRTLTDLRRGP